MSRLSKENVLIGIDTIKKATNYSSEQCRRIYEAVHMVNESNLTINPTKSVSVVAAAKHCDLSVGDFMCAWRTWGKRNRVQIQTRLL